MTKQTKTETIAETEVRLKKEAIANASQLKAVRHVLDAFEGAEVVDVASNSNQT